MGPTGFGLGFCVGISIPCPTSMSSCFSNTLLSVVAMPLCVSTDAYFTSSAGISAVTLPFFMHLVVFINYRPVNGRSSFFSSVSLKGVIV